MYENSRLRREMSRYLADMRERNLGETYIDHSRRLLLPFAEFCKGLGIGSAKAITADTIRNFMAQYAQKTASYQQFVYAVVRGFLVFVENPAVLKFRLRVRGQARIHVDWLSPQEMDQILSSPMDVREACILGLGFLAGFRSIEMRRMTAADAKEAVSLKRLRARGKGGKERVLPVCADLETILKATLLTTDKADDDPLLGISYTTLRRTLVKATERAGRRCTTHTPRRTYCRNMWLLGIPMETIAELMGHSSTDVTRKYAGLNLSDMTHAMERYAQAYGRAPQIVPARI